MEDKMIPCGKCSENWTVRVGPEGRGYLRADLIELAPVIAAHMRDEHDDEDSALRFEKWAVTPAPWRTAKD